MVMRATVFFVALSSPSAAKHSSRRPVFFLSVFSFIEQFALGWWLAELGLC